MELAQLENLVILSEHLHFRRAAVAAGVSASTLSRQIGDLEADLDVRLFDRNRRQVSLTPAGRMYVDEAKAVLHRLRFAAIDARRVARGEQESLRIGHGDAVGLALLQLALPRLRASFRDLRLEVVEAPSEDLLDRLVARSIDVALIRPPVRVDGLADEHLCEEELVVVLPVGHRLAGERPVSMADLAGEPLVVPPRSLAPGAYDMIMAQFTGHRVRPEVIQEGSTASSVMLLVAAGLGVAVMPVFSTYHIDLNGIEVRPLAGPSATLALHAAWRDTDDLETISPFRTFLAEAVEECAAGPRRGIFAPAEGGTPPHAEPE